jgi:hypothetical protein
LAHTFFPITFIHGGIRGKNKGKWEMRKNGNVETWKRGNVKIWKKYKHNKNKKQ